LQSRSGWIRNAVADSVAPTKGQEGVVNGFEPHRSSDLHMEDRQAWQGNSAAVAVLQQSERLRAGLVIPR